MASRTLTPGTVIGGDFVIERPLSAGGMGAVYVCLQKSTGKRRALKVMLPELMTDPSLRQRFVQEAQVGARIESEHIVEVVAAGLEPVPWLAMELLDGEDLGRHITENGPLAFATTRAILEQACHALAAAHESGIVHRDLKPENIFLGRPRQVGGAFKVKILDFGIAKIADEASTEAGMNTSAMGSRPWMAPEQASVGTPIGPEADVWALGLIAFFLLTGKYYWRAMYDPNRNDMMLMIEACVSGALDPPSVRARELGATATLPTGFDGWFARCLVRDATARFKDAKEAYEALVTDVGAAAPVDSLAATDLAPGIVPSIAMPVALPARRPARLLAIAAFVVALPIAAWAVVVASKGSPKATTPNATSTSAMSEVSSDAPSVSPNAKASRRCPSNGGEMVLVHGGKLRMGSGDGAPEERPVHEVEVADFCLDKTEVTVSAFAECVKAGGAELGYGCNRAPTTVDWPGITDERKKFWSEACNADKPDRGLHPINCVDWASATMFCAWAGKSLPTEEQWEYAARGSEGRTYPWGDTAPGPRFLNACDSECIEWGKQRGEKWTAMFSGSDGFPTTAVVGSFIEGDSKDGIHDLAGNVWEWTSSGFSTDYSVDRAATAQVYRGGSWHDNAAPDTRAAARGRGAPTIRRDNLGFRCAR